MLILDKPKMLSLDMEEKHKKKRQQQIVHHHSEGLENKRKARKYFSFFFHHTYPTVLLLYPCIITKLTYISASSVLFHHTAFHQVSVR
mmetsp:Transcript_33571/g.37495  ORF Transcript_33571/g.37495 Transcript_33571/m.37495 type:complete len:88 (+) Transcript_33571:321-584(+)